MLKVGIINFFSLSWVKHHSFNSQYFLKQHQCNCPLSFQRGCKQHFLLAIQSGRKKKNLFYFLPASRLNLPRFSREFLVESQKSLTKQILEKQYNNTSKQKVMLWQLCDRSVSPAQNLRNPGFSHHLSCQFTTHSIMESWEQTVAQIYFLLLLQIELKQSWDNIFWWVLILLIEIMKTSQNPFIRILSLEPILSEIWQRTAKAYMCFSVKKALQQC